MEDGKIVLTWKKFDRIFSLTSKRRILFTAFAKLNSEGLGEITYQQYLEYLNLFWRKINKYYG